MTWGILSHVLFIADRLQDSSDHGPLGPLAWFEKRANKCGAWVKDKKGGVAVERKHYPLS